MIFSRFGCKVTKSREQNKRKHSFFCRALNFGVQNEAKITNCGGLSILPFAAAPCFCHLLFDFALDSPSKRVVLQLASK
jgi:hypothetical protein